MFKQNDKKEQDQIDIHNEEDDMEYDDAESTEDDEEEIEESEEEHENDADNSDEDMEDEEEQTADISPKPHNLKAGHDIGEGRTVFLRNLSYDTEEEDLRALMEEYFGSVVFAKLVMDKVMGHPRGTGFVKFRRREDAEKCVEVDLEFSCGESLMVFLGWRG